jgi:GrpB-like predicted nucleotidyltransferase (UPF0157 family)
MRPPTPVTIEIVDHDPAWPARFDEHRARIASALAGLALRIEHIGSTSVPGLAAKPIVDVLVTVADPEDEPAYLPALLAAGYELRVREPGHRMVRPPTHDANVHVWAAGCDEERRYLALRDRLRADAADRDRYAAVKRELATRTWPTVDHYAVAKTAVIEAILARAMRDSGAGAARRTGARRDRRDG